MSMFGSLIRDLHPLRPEDYIVVDNGTMYREKSAIPIRAAAPVPEDNRAMNPPASPWKPGEKMQQVWSVFSAGTVTVETIVAKTGLQPRQVREAVASLLRNRRIERVYDGAANRWIAFYRATEVSALRTPRVAVAGGDIEPGQRDAQS
jgi:hypothetical protein